MIQNDMCCLGVSMDRIELSALEARGHLVGVGNKKCTHGRNEDSEQIHIIIFGSHAHSLLPREACDKMVMDTTEIQKDMGEKRVMDLKNIQKAVKEAELNGDKIKRPKQRNPSTLKICTYDMETCDTSMEHKKKEDTHLSLGRG